MSDLELIKRCAEKMGYDLISTGGQIFCRKPFSHPAQNNAEFVYNPLTDDAQAMALVKRFGLIVERIARRGEETWFAAHNESGIFVDDDLNRCICECVARMP